MTASRDIIQQDPFATYNPVPLSNLTETVTQIHFPTYFAAFTPRKFPERIVVTSPAYAASLATILNETSSKVVEAYLVTRAALALSPYLGMSTDAWKTQRSLYETLSGIKKGAVGDRSEYCIGIVEDNLGFAAGRFFVNQTFGGNSREKGTKVITGIILVSPQGAGILILLLDIVQSFKDSLTHIDWMDKESAKAAAEKVRSHFLTSCIRENFTFYQADAIRVKVGFPLSPDTRDPRSIARYYSGVKSSKDDFFGNILSSAFVFSI